jgi:acetyltransferase EpsM
MPTARELVIIGGGEHARVVIDAALSRPDLWKVLGIVDPKPCDYTTRLLGVRRLGDEQKGLRLAARDNGPAFVIGVGGVGLDTPRPAIAARFALDSRRWATVIHARASVSPVASLGPGVVVMAGAIVNAGATVAEHAILNTGCVVEHDVQIGAFTQVSPGAIIGGAAIIGEGSYLGLGCGVRDHVRIGRGVMVGMGAVVVGDVSDRDVVVGCPAKPVPKRRPKRPKSKRGRG